ncbi:MAG: 2-C-methyl-D-erythritol 4-phosphate cytidylyltransferase, partial [Elusimicrobia bacterium]|nr:2-C-methyl-D-erythritol 4-phosphate cytidylyltransferase [Elusimicrobiota bacterium]
MKKISVIIPAAGLGKRLRPYTEKYPKVLLNAGAKPVLGHVIDGARNTGKIYFI